LYLRLLGAQIRSQCQYRFSLILDMTAAAFGAGIGFATLALLFQRFDRIGGWTLTEIAFLYGLVETAFGLTDMLFSGFDPDAFAPKMVQRGGFDQVLLRPIDVTVQILGSDIALRRLGRIAQGVAVLGFATSSAGIHWTPLKAIYLPVVIASMLAFFGGLFIIGSTSTFWTVQRVEVINIFTYGGSEMMAYPMHIYNRWMRRFFTYVVPAIFLNYYPALYFLDKADPLDMPTITPFLSPLIGFGAFGVALAFWRFGVRRYSSTGT
ncbi:MAG TPA: ABC transporter permease, partial [Chloroflexi bacterium]|nr:ABC transporter permease [Chloroflexota bacterium]